MGASVAEGLAGAGVAAVVVAGGVSCCRSVQAAVAAVVRASKATPPRQTPDRGHRVIHSRHGRVPVDFAAAGGAARISHLSPAWLDRKTAARWRAVRNIEPARSFRPGNVDISGGAGALKTGQPTACRSHLPNGRSSPGGPSTAPRLASTSFLMKRPRVRASELLRLRHRSDEFLHQVIHPSANRFVGCREAIAQSGHFVPTDQSPARLWQCCDTHPIEITTSAAANSSGATFRGFAMGTE